MCRARAVNDANCLCLGENIVPPKLGCEMADAFLGARFLDADGIPAEVLAFWQEARDELMSKGLEATERTIETL